MPKPIRNILLLVALAMIAFAHWADSSETASGAMPGSELPGTHWRVEDIDGRGVVDTSRTTIGFFEENHAAGDTGCNRFSGTFTLDGASLTFGPMAGTRRGCVQALMNQETAFYQALGRVKAWEVSEETGLLHLRDAAGNTVIRAHRIEQGEA